ncbi:MAG: hypothetical protein ABI036_18095 [Fibrobacteria bacterium]
MKNTLRAFLAILLIPSSIPAAIPEAAHPDYNIAEIRMPMQFKTMGMAFFEDGTLALATTELLLMGEVPELDVNGKVYLIKGLSTDTLPAQIKEVSNYWHQLSGVTVAEGRLYVSDRDAFYEIPNLINPEDLKANRKLMVEWPNEDKWNFGAYFHQWVFTPLYMEGSFYAPYSGSIRTGGWSNVDPTSRFSGAFLKWDAQGNLQALAGGLRSPNGANADPATGDIFVTDNQGSWLPASTFMRIRKGRFYGHRQSSPDVDEEGNVLGTHAPNFAESLPYDPPVAWLPYGSVRCSPSQPILLRKGTFSGDWIIGDVNNPGLVRVSLDKVGEEYNGAVFMFSRGTGVSAINRLVEAPDGGIVIGTVVQIGGNWPSGDKSPLYKLTAKSQGSAFDIKAVRSYNDGLELEFTQPVNPDSIRPEHFTVKSTQYIRQKEYGLGKQDDESLAVLLAEPSKDRRRVHLKIDSLKTDRMIYVRVNGVVSSGGKLLWNNEAWYTLNVMSEKNWNSVAVRLAAEEPGIGPSLAMRVFPGPASTLEVTARCGSVPGGCGAGSGFEAILFDPMGKELARNSGFGSEAVHLAHPGHDPGLYLVRVRSRSGSKGLSVTQSIVF